MNAATQIMTSLEKVLAPLDAQQLVDAQAWAKRRVEALREFKESDEYQQLRSNAWALYPRLFAIAGGKNWYNVFNGRSATAIEEFVAKNCAACAAKRNATIAMKLTKAGATDVVSEQYTQTNNGFDGLYVVNTDDGKKSVKIRTIYAGGWNIQCLHVRVTVKVNSF